MNILITGSNGRLCNIVSKLCKDAGFTICKTPKAPLQLFSDPNCNCAVRRHKGLFSGPMDSKLGNIFLLQLREKDIKVIFIDDETKKYSNQLAKHIVEKNPKYIHLTLTKNIIFSQPEKVTELIKSKFEI